MDAAGQVIADFIGKDGLATAALIFLGWFLTTRIWPFLTKEYWPALGRREDQRNAVMKVLSENLIELKSGQARMLDAIERNDDSQRANSRVLLESISALHTRLSGVPLASATAAEVIIRKMGEKEEKK
jgi:hypothetical protein